MGTAIRAGTTAFVLALTALSSSAQSIPVSEIPAFRESAKRIGATGTPQEIQAFLDAARAKYASASYRTYCVIAIDISVAINTSAVRDKGRAQLARAIAVSTLDEAAKKPLDCAVRLCLLLQSDFDYVDGSLKGGEWLRERSTRVKRWIKVWDQVALAGKDLIDPEDLPILQVQPPPGSGIMAGDPPESIQNRELRKQYEDAIVANDLKVARHEERLDYERAQRAFVPQAKRYLVEAYCKPPYLTQELESFLAASAIDKVAKDSVLAEVRARTSIPAPVKTTVATKVPAPASPLTWRFDPRLQARVSIDLRSPTVDDVLRELSRATKVRLTRAEDIQQTAPAVGSLSTRDVPAWQVMDQLARSRRVEGAWQTRGDGYQLVSNGTPAHLSEAATDPVAPPGADLRKFLWVLLAGNIALVLLAAAGYRWFRIRRAGKHPPPSTDPTQAKGPRP